MPAVGKFEEEGQSGRELVVRKREEGRTHLLGAATGW